MTNKHQSSRVEATLIPGDGIGPEIVAAVQIVLDALGSPFVWDIRQAGMAGIEKFGDPLPAETLDSIRRTKLALKAPLTTPIGGGFRSANVRLREEFGLYANVRPAAAPTASCANCRTGRGKPLSANAAAHRARRAPDHAGRRNCLP
jgi:isocitrate dehydrogenase (NAD+)